jgi:hypothetical protein
MYSRGNGRLMINNNDDGDDVSSFSGSLFSFPIWFPIKMKVLLKEYLDSRCALIYPIVSSLDSRLELFKLFLRIGSILFSVSIQFGKRKKKFLHERKGWRPSRGNDFSPFVRFVRIHRLIWNSFYHSPELPTMAIRSMAIEESTASLSIFLFPFTDVDAIAIHLVY